MNPNSDPITVASARPAALVQPVSYTVVLIFLLLKSTKNWLSGAAAIIVWLSRGMTRIIQEQPKFHQ